MVDGGFIVAIVAALVGSISIHLLWTKNPKNFPVETLNAHFSGFVLNL